MPWTTRNYPNTWNNFYARVRNKAIDIANALLKEGDDEAKVIRIATTKAEEWAKNRGIPVFKQGKKKSKQ